MDNLRTFSQQMVAEGTLKNSFHIIFKFLNLQFKSAATQFYAIKKDIVLFLFEYFAYETTYKISYILGFFIC